MDSSDVLSEFLSRIRPYWFALLLALLGIISLTIGFSQLQSRGEDEIVFEEGESSEDAQSGSMITVDIEGAVLRPGVYEMNSGSRLQDALSKAGGLSDDADRQRIAREINLASLLTDGAKLYFPLITDAQAGPGSQAGGGSINVNTASISELEALPGVGPATAGKIIDARPYQKPEELVSKKAISQSVFEKIREKISVY